MLDHILRFSLTHRFLVVMITILAAAIGAFSFTRLTIDAVPDITNNQVAINAVFPALSPVEVEKQITFPIETALAGIPGLQYTRSLSRNGFSQVIAVFDDDVNIYLARQQVSERLREASDDMPPGAEPTLGPISTGLGEVSMWTVTFAHPGGEGATVVDGQAEWQSDGSYLTQEGQRLRTEVARLAYLRTVQDWVVRPQLRGVPGLAEVEALGGYEKQYVVTPDPMRLFARGLGFADVVEALERNNTSEGAGYVEREGESVVVRTEGRVKTTDDIAQVVISEVEGVPIHIADVGEIAIGGELRMGAGSEDGREVVLGTALMLIGANGRLVARAVGDKLDLIRKGLPPDVELRVNINRTRLVDATIHTVAKNLIEGALLVVVVLFVLLGNLRAAVITALAIPLAMLLTVTGMVETKVSGNLMSLGAIDFGLIVDGAVIIVENCLRRIAQRQGELGHRLDWSERLDVIRVAAREMVRPSAFGQAIIITVYIPVVLLTGVEGKMFRPMALTVMFALASAFVLSLTFIPAMASIFLSGRVRERESVIIRACKWIYEPVLRATLRLRPLVIVAALVIIVMTGWLFTRLGQEFLPTLDEGDVCILTARIPSTGLTESTSLQLAIERTLKQFPEVSTVFSKTGTADMASDPLAPCEADTFVVMKPRSQWPEPDLPKDELIARFQKELEKVPGTSYEFSQPIEDRFNEMIAGVRSDVAVKVRGDEYEQILPTAKAVMKILGTIQGAEDLKMGQTEGLPALQVTVDRAAIGRYGLSVADVQDVVTIAMGGREAGLVFEGDRRFPIVVRLPDAMREDLAVLEALPVPIPARDHGAEAKSEAATAYVPLSAVAHIEETEGYNEVSRENGKRFVAVTANVRERDIGSFVSEAQEKIYQQVKLPAGVWLDWGGQFQNLIAARERLLVVLPLCFLLIFMLLFTTFDSVRYAIIVFTGVPFALTGGVVSLWLRGFPFSITAAVGFIALSGVAVLNGLVMVTSINQLRAQGTRLHEAIVRGSLLRVRPVLMTALVASLGFIPMAVATGTGAEVQKPLATVVIGGLVSSTLLTLVVLPAIYRLSERRRSRENAT